MNQTFYIMASLAIAMLAACIVLGVVIAFLERRVEQLLNKLEDLKKQKKVEEPKRTLTLKPKEKSISEGLWDSVKK